ncbi:cupin domain-containing protein [Falsiroseomonas selenitidurans]|uniref:Cupin domain-containing protein n=1 Tax=Falsiroseomonas selenitidurans TaxID=2716335 RepID=A0ABX1EHT1_9PROT|nr:cupin domain-containing protein [Falsiroseomonas selenitidurans]NKC34420.1 cupin domain-containing protein [Falsiroseomonas selenitidurans]
MARRIDPALVAPVIGSAYPPPHDLPCRARERRRLGDAAGLTQFGVNLLRLPPGAWSSQRHWHKGSDEFVFVLAGEVTLVTDSGPEVLRAGDAAGFCAGEADGHHLRNLSAAEALVLEVGSRIPGDDASYSDIDLRAPPHDDPAPFTTRDGVPLPRP